MTGKKDNANKQNWKDLLTEVDFLCPLRERIVQQVLEAGMYFQGVSTRQVKAITEELCGHEFSASTVSRINQRLDKEPAKFARRPLEEEYPYMILDARYEQVREDGVIRQRARLHMHRVPHKAYAMLTFR